MPAGSSQDGSQSSERSPSPTAAAAPSADRFAFIGKRKQTRVTAQTIKRGRASRQQFADAKLGAARPIRIVYGRQRRTQRGGRGRRQRRARESPADGYCDDDCIEWEDDAHPDHGPSFRERTHDERWHRVRSDIVEQEFTHCATADSLAVERAQQRSNAIEDTFVASVRTARTCPECKLHTQEVLCITHDCAFKTHVPYIFCERCACASILCRPSVYHVSSR